MMGKHPIKHWASQQGVVALSSGEAEYYAIVKAVSQSIGIRSLLKDMKQDARIKIKVKTDASAAVGISMRSGLGKLRHMDTSQLWVQEKVRSGEVEVIKIATWENLADTLTKYVSKDAIGKHMKGSASWFEGGRHELMPEVDDDEEDEGGWFDEEGQGDEGDKEQDDEKEDEKQENVFWLC